MNYRARSTLSYSWWSLACIACFSGILCQDYSTKGRTDATSEATRKSTLSRTTRTPDDLTTISTTKNPLITKLWLTKLPKVSTEKSHNPVDPPTDSGNNSGSSVFTIAISQAVILIIILIFYASYRLCKNSGASNSNSSQIQAISGNRGNLNAAENGMVHGDIPPSYSFCLESGVINGSIEEDPPSYHLALRLKQGLPIVPEAEVSLPDSLHDSSTNIENSENTSRTSLSSDETVREQ